MQKRGILLIMVMATLLVAARAQQTGLVERGAYRFTIPEGWAGQSMDGAYMMASYNEPGMILLVESDHTAVSDLKNEVKNGLTDHYSYEFRLIGDITDHSENHFSCDFEGTLQGEQARGVIDGVLDPGLGGLLIIAMTTPDMFSDRYPELSGEIAESLEVIEQPPVSAPSGVSSAGHPLVGRYTGVKLTYMSSYYSSSYSSGGVSGGYSDQEEISLCNSGSFTFNSSSETSAGGSASSMYGQSGDRGDGTWKIVPSAPDRGVLELHFNDGRVNKYQLEVNEKGETYLDGYRYYRTTGADGPEYAPVCY